jgi:hypothetical protein
MNDAERFESEAARLEKVLFKDGFHVAGRDTVQIEDVGYRDANRVGLRFNRFHKSKARRAEAYRA